VATQPLRLRRDLALALAGVVAGGGIAGVAIAEERRPQDRRPDPLAHAIHAEYTMPMRGGTFTNLATQKGDLQALTPTSITVSSADGFTRTYVMDDKTRVSASEDGLVAGDDVAVHAEAVDGVMRARAVREIVARPKPTRSAAR
jgi:hypothetical protein